MKLHILLLISCMVLPTAVFTQEAAPHRKDIATSFISVQPFFLTADALRIDYDQMVTPNNWLVFSPILFLSDNSAGSDAFSGANFKTHRGAGFHLHHRYYPGGLTGSKSPFYISYGLMWHYHDMTYSRRELTVSSEARTMINKWGGEVTIGLMAFTSGLVHIDFYTGLGIRHSDFRFSGNGDKRFNGRYMDPGYSGTVMLLGVRLGIVSGTGR